MDSARTKALDFFLLYPATLKIKEGAQYRAFTSAEDAEKYVSRAPSRPHTATETTDGPAANRNDENALEEVQD